MPLKRLNIAMVCDIDNIRCKFPIYKLFSLRQLDFDCCELRRRGSYVVADEC